LSQPEPLAAATPSYEPRRPALLATAAFALWPVILSLPMLAGMWLASPWSDQYSAGFSFHAWSAAWWKRTGHMPLWNPELFGGMPFIAAGSGDVFYPTWLLRLLIPVTAAGNLSFFVHYILAGLFTYALLRRLRVGWTGSVIGGLAYQLSGLIASYPSPGHDGKLFCSTMLPLVCLALVLALKDRRWEGHPLLAVAVALALLGHFQLGYYLLIAAGLFALYLTFEESGGASSRERTGRLALALGAVLLGFGIAAIQVVPFFGYIPFSPRAQGYAGFAGSTSYAIPWNHVLEFFFKNFVGAKETYWGSNPLKLHSEYLGLPVVALAVLGAAVRERRRQIWWLGGIGLLFLLVSLGAATPFYKLWWAVMPLVKKTRAPGQAFFIVAFVTAIFAGIGAERALTTHGRRLLKPAVIVGGVVTLLGITGVLGHFAESVAALVQAATGGGTAAAQANQSAILWGAASSGLALAATGLVAGLIGSGGGDGGRLTPRTGALALILIVGADLWLNARQFWSYTKPFGPDQVIARMASTPPPYRVMNLPRGGAYPGSVLMAFDVPEVFGYHGNELRYYDELWGGKNEWKYLGVLSLWDLWAVRYAVLPAGGRVIDSIPGFRRIMDSVPALDGARVNLFERTDPAPYARVVPGAIKTDSAAIVSTLVHPQMDGARLVLFTNDQPVTPAPLTKLPAPIAARATVTFWQPGRMTIALDPAPVAAAYVLVAENWYPDWVGKVDGQPAPVLRGDYSLLTVPVPAGAKVVELTFRSKLYELGRTITLASLAILVITFAASLAGRRTLHG
jgi:hypothetical protein